MQTNYLSFTLYDIKIPPFLCFFNFVFFINLVFNSNVYIFLVPPTIVSKPNETEVDQGRSIFMKCDVRGHPIPNVIWARAENDTSVIKESPRFIVFPGGSLLIQDAQINDTGKCA